MAGRISSQASRQSERWIGERDPPWRARRAAARRARRAAWSAGAAAFFGAVESATMFATALSFSTGRATVRA
jgi:hypothetical protein